METNTERLSIEMKTRSRKKLFTLLAGIACVAALLFGLLLLLPRLIGHGGGERTVAVRIVSIEDDQVTAEVIHDDAPFFAKLPHEIVFSTKMLGSMAAGLEPGERYQAMYLSGATHGKQVKVVSLLRDTSE